MALSTHSHPFTQAFTLPSIERLLPTHRAVPAPFTQEECQELMTLIRSFGGAYQTSFCNRYTYETTDDHDDHGTQTRIISRVLLRVGQSILFKPSHSASSTRLTSTINTQPTGVKPTSDPTNLFLPTSVPTNLAIHWHHANPSNGSFSISSFLVSS